MKILITGASGFVGKHLFDLLSKSGNIVWGLDRSLTPPKEMMGRYASVDLLEVKALNQIVEEIKPDVIFHLASVTSKQQDAGVYEINVVGTINLFEAVLHASLTPRVVLASSSAVYGTSSLKDSPCTEETLLSPINHYGITKVFQEQIFHFYYKVHNIDYVIVRSFNLVGPGMPESLLASSLAKQIIMAESVGSNAKITLGNLYPTRDFVDVRDAVRAYELIMKYGVTAERYNVSTGSQHSVRQCLDYLLKISNVDLEIRENPDLSGPELVTNQYGSFAKLNSLCGWAPEYTLENSLTDLLDYWRKKIKANNTKELK